MPVSINSAVAAYKAAANRSGQVAAPNDGKTSNDFSKMVEKFAKDAIDTLKTGEQQSTAAATGKADLNEVVVAVAEAELTLNTVVSIRDKVLEAYREISRMPL
jgi:flagellar hook-basal body complex protein FliE